MFHVNIANFCFNEIFLGIFFDKTLKYICPHPILSVHDVLKWRVNLKKKKIYYKVF